MAEELVTEESASPGEYKAEVPEMTDETRELKILNLWPPCDRCFRTFTRLLNQEENRDVHVTIYYCKDNTGGGDKKCFYKRGYEGWDGYSNMRETFHRFKIEHYTGDCTDLKNALEKHKEEKGKSPHVSCLMDDAMNCIKSRWNTGRRIWSESYVFNLHGHHSEQRILKRFLSSDNREDWDTGTSQDTCYPPPS